MPRLGTPPVHTHAGAGQGNQLDWDAIFSDAVHSHQSNPEGGTLASAALPNFDTHEDDLDAHIRSPWQVLRTGEYYLSHFITAFSSAGVAIAANTLYAVPFLVARNITVDRIGLQVAASAAGNIRLGIYGDGTNLYPGALTLDAGTIDCSTTGAKVITINQALTRGVYWLAFVSDVTPTLYQVGGAGRFGFLGGGANLQTTNCSWSVSFTYAALPDPFTAGGSFDSNTWWIGVRVASLDA